MYIFNPIHKISKTVKIDYLLYNKNMRSFFIKPSKKIIFYLLLFIITIPAFINLINNSYFPMHDDQHIARLHLLHSAITQGNLYPRWVDTLGFGFGYPLFNFYPPLIYYLADFFVILGASYIVAIKLMVIVGIIVGAIGMYKLASKFMTQGSSFVATALFTYFGYRAATIYVRGAFAEFFAMSLLPMVFLSFYNLHKKPELRQSFIFAFWFALLILAHPFIAVPAILFLSIYFIFFNLFCHSEEQSDVRISSISWVRFTVFSILGSIISLGLSAFYWLPSMLERKYTLTDSILLTELASYKLHYVLPFQFWWSQWGFGGSVAGGADGMSFQLGKIYIGIIAVGFLLILINCTNYFRRKRKFPPGFMFHVSCFILMLFSLFMTTVYSQFIWNNIKPLQYLQFPWRFLSFTAIFVALIGGFAIEQGTKLLQTDVIPYSIRNLSLLNRFPIKSGMTKWLIPILTILLILSIQSKYFAPQRFIQTSDAERTTYDEIAWRISRSSFEFAPSGVITKKSELGTTIIDINQEEITKDLFKVASGAADVKIELANYSNKIFYVKTIEPITFQLHTFNFPGWHAYLSPIVADDSETISKIATSPTPRNDIIISDNNPYRLITVNIPKGIYRLEFRFEDTRVRKYANVLSILTVVITLFYLVSSKNKN